MSFSKTKREVGGVRERDSFLDFNEEKSDHEQHEQKPAKDEKDWSKVKRKDWLDDIDYDEFMDSEVEVDEEELENYNSLAHLKKESFNRTGEFSYLLEDEVSFKEKQQIYSPIAPPKVHKIQKPSFFDLSKDLSIPILFQDDEDEQPKNRSRAQKTKKESKKSRLRRKKKKKKKFNQGFGLNGNEENLQNPKLKKHFKNKNKIQKHTTNETSLLSVFSNFSPKTKSRTTPNGTLTKEEKRQLKKLNQFKKTQKRSANHQIKNKKSTKQTPKSPRRAKKTPRSVKKSKKGKISKNSNGSDNSKSTQKSRIKRMKTWKKTPKKKNNENERSGIFNDGFKIFKQTTLGNENDKMPPPKRKPPQRREHEINLPENDEFNEALTKRGGGSFRMLNDGKGNLSFMSLASGFDLEEVEVNQAQPPPLPSKVSKFNHVKRENIKNKSSSVPVELSYNMVHQEGNDEFEKGEKSRSGTM